MHLKEKSIHFILILFISIAIGYLLLVLSYMIPFDKVLMGCANSIPVFQQEDTYPLVINGYANSQLDNYTDGAMLNFALYSDDRSPFINAVECCRYHFENKNPMESFMSYLWMEDGYSVITYPRYWHGFLIFLKPLLMCMSYTDIRVLNSLFQLLLLGAVLWQLTEKKLQRHIPPLLLTVFYLVPSVLAMSLQYSSVYNLALFSTLILFLFYKKIKEKNLFPELFLITGILTGYFDLLTYPLITLGFPLLFTIVLMQREKKPLKSLLTAVLLYSFSWGLGYAGMWAGKWLLTVLVLGTASFSSITGALENRSLIGAAEGGVSVKEVIWNNLELLNKPIYKLLPVIMLLYHSALTLFRHIRLKELLRRLLPYIPVILMPFIWYILTANHAMVHSWFTYRTLSVAILGFFCLLTAGSER